MNMNINEKKVLYAFGCPVLKATVERLRMLAALTPDPATKKLFYTLAIKLLADRTDEWYRCFFYNLRMEMEGYFNAQLKGSPAACHGKENRKDYLPRYNPFQRNEQGNHE